MIYPKAVFYFNYEGPRFTNIVYVRRFEPACIYYTVTWTRRDCYELVALVTICGTASCFY